MRVARRSIIELDVREDERPTSRSDIRGVVRCSTHDRTTNQVGVFYNKGDGTFGAQVPYLAGTEPHAIALGDLNGDHRLDIVVANRYSGSVGGISLAAVSGYLPYSGSLGGPRSLRSDTRAEDQRHLGRNRVQKLAELPERWFALHEYLLEEHRLEGSIARRRQREASLIGY